MKKVRIKVIFAAIFMFALLAAGMIAPADFATSYAAESEYTTVLDDLKKDPSFRSADYPANSADSKYSFNVIQIAETTAGELFVYTYQPTAGAKKLSATSISISITINEDYDPKLYALKELSSQGVFGKYHVKGFKVQSGSERYYDISEIFRAWNANIDKPAEGSGTSGTTISEVSFAVGKLYTARTENGAVTYECTTTETVEILKPVHGSLRYVNGMTPPFATMWKNSCDSWFVAFSTDKKIDNLMSAKVYYVAKEYETYEYSGTPSITKYKDPQELYATPTDKDQASNNPHLWLKGKPRNWDRIQSVSEFIRMEELEQEIKNAVSEKQWVLRFVETEYEERETSAWGSKNKKIKGTEISDISILRLEFETNGIVYNLGAVDNKYTPDTDPDNNDQNKFDWSTIVPNVPVVSDFIQRLITFFTGKSDWWVYVLVILGALILLPTILGLLIPAFGKVLLSILKALGKGLWWLICLPFRIIAAPFKAISKRRKKDKRA